MLGVHYIILLVLFVGIIMGVTLVCSQSLYVIRKPLKDSMSLYDPQSTNEDKREATESWDHIQQKARQSIYNIELLIHDLLSMMFDTNIIGHNV